jgi:hypothetical protein
MMGGADMQIVEQPEINTQHIQNVANEEFNEEAQ